MTSPRIWDLLGLCLLIALPIIAVGYLIGLIQPILMPFLTAIALAYLGDPLADRLQRRGLSRTLAVCIVFAALFLLLALLLLLLVPLLSRQIAYLYGRLPDMLAWLEQSALPWLQSRLGLEAEWPALDTETIRAQIAVHWDGAGDLVKLMLAQATRSSLAFMGWLANVALIPVVTFYLLRDWDGLLEKLERLLPRPLAPTVTALARECDAVLGAFVRGQLLVMAALGVIYSLGLWAVGLKLALLIGMLAGLASIVPYLGFAVGIGAATVAGIFQFGDLVHLLLIWGVFLIGQALESMVLTPYLVGDRIGLHPVVVIFAVLAGGELFGFVGILLALPVAAVLMVLVRHAVARYLNSGLYRQTPSAGG